MSPSLSDHFLKIPIVKKICDKVNRVHTKRNDKGDISHLTTKIMNLTQSNRTMMEYASKLEMT